jgi:hypothetical protein
MCSYQVAPRNVKNSPRRMFLKNSCIMQFISVLFGARSYGEMKELVGKRINI